MSQFLGQVLNCCKKENVDLANARIFQFPYYFGTGAFEAYSNSKSLFISGLPRGDIVGY